MFFIGADVSKGKWLTVRLSESESWEVRLFQTIREIWDSYSDARLILIDVPIGLREDGGEERLCDKEARGLLGWPRRSSVFRVPCRAALEVANYDDAKRINKDRTGKSLTIQTWGIIPKIVEVDEFLHENISARSRIREIHPEVCFWSLNGGKPMMFKKKKIDGLRERMTVLRRACNQTDAIVKLARHEFRGKVTDNDILDALAAAVTAFLGRQRLLTLPENPEVDARGLRMEMVYYPML